MKDGKLPARPTWRGVAVVGTLGVLLLAAGIVGFHHLLGGPWHDSVYRTAVTVTLTGLDSQPAGPAAQYLTILLAVGGVAIFGYAAARAAEAIAREVAGDARRDKRRVRTIESISDHFIICGYGRVGRRAADEFEASGQPYVVLDKGDEAIEVARERGVLFRKGSGSDDGDLERVGISR